MGFVIFIAALCFCSVWASPLEDVPRLVPVPLKDMGVRIINGERAENGQLPWQVAIMGRSSTIPRYLCGGTLISEEWVLTAGHCVEGAISAVIYTGEVRLSSTNRTTSQASDFILHEDYDSTSLNNDIGLIKLATPLTFDGNTKAIPLAEQELQSDTVVTVSGWGETSDTDPTPNSDYLNYVNLSTIDNDRCKVYYGGVTVGPGLVCTSTGDDAVKSPCLGDSGGPVVLNAFTDPVLVGVFSFVNGYGCEYPYPAGHTRIAYYREWIRTNSGV